MMGAEASALLLFVTDTDCRRLPPYLQRLAGT